MTVITAREFGTTYLQGIGEFRAVRADSLKAGDLTVWAHGCHMTVFCIVPISNSSVAIVWRGDDGLVTKARTYRRDRMIGFPIQDGEK